MTKIVNWMTGKVIFESTTKTVKETVEEAVKQEVSLKEADLAEADLQEADLREADLAEANLWIADLWEADLRKADLNAIFFKTKITKKQKEYIMNETDLFEVVESEKGDDEK